MKKILSFLLISALISTMVPLGAKAIKTQSVRLSVTYPLTDLGIGAEAGKLVSGNKNIQFFLKNDQGMTLCVEEKNLPINNGAVFYELGSQYGVNLNGDTVGCNLDTFSQYEDYKIVAKVDINNNGSYSDGIDYTSGDISYKVSADNVYDKAYMDSTIFNQTMKIVNGLGGETSNDNNIEYNIKAGEFSVMMMGAGNKAKTFDFDRDGYNEVVVKPQTGNGNIYVTNRTNGSFETIFNNANITLDDNTNLFVTYKGGNFLLYANTFGTDPNSVKNNFTGTSYSIVNGIIVSATQTIKSFKFGSFITISLGGKDITFAYNGISRQYEQNLSVDIGVSSGLYDSVTSASWFGTPFASQSTDYYGGNVRELIFNGITYTNVDGVFYGDFNKDNQLDVVTYSKIQNSDKVKFTVILTVSNGVNKEILKDYTGDSINIGESLVDNSADFSGTDIPEIIISNGVTKDIFRITQAWSTNPTGIGNSNTVIKIATFDSSFYYVVGGSNSVNTSFARIDSNFREVNESNKNDKFLLVGNLKVNKDGYDYYDYILKQYNGSEFIDLKLSGNANGWKITGNKIGFRKIGNSNFFLIYVDQSSQWTFSKPDKTNLYYIKNGELFPIMTDVIVNGNNNSVSQDGTINEGGEKVLINAKFGLFGISVDGLNEGTLSFDNKQYISSLKYDYIHTTNEEEVSKSILGLNFDQYGTNTTNLLNKDGVFLKSLRVDKIGWASTTVGGVFTANILNSSGVIVDTFTHNGSPKYEFVINKFYTGGIIVKVIENGKGEPLNIYYNEGTFYDHFNITGNSIITTPVSSIFGRVQSGTGYYDQGIVFDSSVFTNKGLIYDAIKDKDWGIGAPRTNSGNNSVFNINNNIKLGGRYKISDYVDRNTFINNNFKIFYKNNTSLGIFGNNLLNLNLYSLGGDRTKHSVTNLRNYESTGLWGANNQNYMYLDDSNNKIIYFDNGGLGFLEKNNHAKYGGNFFPYLDTGNYFGIGANRIVWGNKNWNAGQNGYGGTNNDAGGLNKNFGLQGGFAYGRTTSNIHMTFVSNSYYGSSWSSSYRVINQYGDVYGATFENIGYYWIDGGASKNGSYSFFPLY